MTRGFSNYLNLLRLLAALQVVIAHLTKPAAVGLGPNSWFKWEHEAVIVFFVLSGLVIHHSALKRDLDLNSFLASRFSRVYPVALCCLVLTILFDAVTLTLAPHVYGGEFGQASLQVPIMSFVLSVLMLNESWASFRFFSNAPYWSLCFEFWYYILFAILFYCTGRARLICGSLAALIMGPRILILFPVWLAGAFAYSETYSSRWPKWIIWVAAGQVLVVFGMYVAFDLRDVVHGMLAPSLRVKLVWSQYFITDMVLGASFAVHIVAMKQLDMLLLRLLSKGQTLIKFGADRSFTLYLMHIPLMFMLAALSERLLGGPSPWLIGLGTIIIPMLCAPIIEDQRHIWRPVIRRALDRFEPRGRSTLRPVSNAL
jgi:peptidoglycan/LPS O-acetylase OafA/YrhL